MTSQCFNTAEKITETRYFKCVTTDGESHTEWQLINENAKTKLKKSNSTFFRILIYKFCCDKKNTYFDVYSKFRMKIISEEHFIRNHLNIYHLLKLKEKRGNRIKKKHSYKIDNLFNLV